jgi:hypothetical protein
MTARSFSSFLILFATLLAGCQSWSQPNPNSSFFRPPAGSTLTLTRPITIPADKLAVYVQDGTLERDAQINHYRPYCKFELRTRAPDARQVEPDTFTIERTRQDIPLAMRDSNLVPVGMDGDGMKYFIYETILDLRSTRQPEVSRLTCTQWQYPPFMQHVTINEMRQALGDLFRLRLPGE